MKESTIWFGLLSLLCLSSCSQDATSAANIDVTTVPATVYTVVEGVAKESGDTPDTQDLSWLFHLVFESREAEPLSFDEAHVSFKRGEETLWYEALSREYLGSMEWIEGAYQLDTRYFLDNVMFGKEVATEPELPAGESVTWVRIPFVRPAYADIDNIHLMFHLRDGPGSLANGRALDPADAPRAAREAAASVLGNLGRSQGKRRELGPPSHRFPKPHHHGLGFRQVRRGELR